jgi:hypothetical protein
LTAKTTDEIYNKILEDFQEASKQEYRRASGIGFLSEAVSRSLETAFTEIENNKDPHIYTKLNGDNLTKTGTFVGVARNENEDDSTYLYRIMNWTHLKAASNYTAINDSLLDLTYASNAQYFPATHGAGTGTVYVIPNEYTDETIANALSEAQQRIQNVISPSSYTEFLVPDIIPVRLTIRIASQNGDMAYLKSSLEMAIKKYINSIAPGDYLEVGTINKLGANTENVDYFNVLELFLTDDNVTDLRILQAIETKFIFDTIDWQIDEEEEE